MPTPVTVFALLFALLGLAFLIAAASALRRRRPLRLVTRLAFSLMLLAVGAAFGLLALGMQGYRALTHEALAAVVEIEPLDARRFNARFRFTDGRVAAYRIAGDEVYVDAHILKWKPLANLIGLHTAYQLDRVAGRYRELDAERSAPRTVYTLGSAGPVDLFDLRRRYSVLAPLVDAEYGSATFVAVDQPVTLEIRVSTTGLLIRRVNGSL